MAEQHRSTIGRAEEPFPPRPVFQSEFNFENLKIRIGDATAPIPPSRMIPLSRLQNGAQKLDSGPKLPPEAESL